MNCRRHELDISDKEKCCLFLIDHGANVNGAGVRNPPLHMAISAGCYQIAKALIKVGANITAVSNATGWTPLHYAYPLPLPSSTLGSIYDDLILFYLEMFPEIGGRDCAMRCHRHSPIAEFMIENGSDVNIPGNHNLTPFHVAIKNDEG